MIFTKFWISKKFLFQKSFVIKKINEFLTSTKFVPQKSFLQPANNEQGADAGVCANAYDRYEYVTDTAVCVCV